MKPQATRSTPQPRKSPRQARSRHTVDAILDAAARVFAQEGYESTTTNRIADVAGVSVGSLYQYFPNKDALVAALHRRHSQQMRAVMTTVLDAASRTSLRDGIAALVRALLAAHLIDPELHRMLERELPFFDDARDEDSAYMVVVQRVGDLFARHGDALVPANSGLAAWVVLRMLESLVHAAVLEPPRGASIAEIETAIVDMALAYLTGGRAPAR
jgi:AcrR family transcriptional regulator